LGAEDDERLYRALNQQRIQHNQGSKMSAESNTAVGIAVTAQAWEAIAGAYDLQTHVAPDVIERRIDDLDLAQEFLAHGLNGVVVIKRELAAEVAALGQQRLEAALADATSLSRGGSRWLLL
jgi:hypothetical protein